MSQKINEQFIGFSKELSEIDSKENINLMDALSSFDWVSHFKQTETNEYDQLKSDISYPFTKQNHFLSHNAYKHIIFKTHNTIINQYNLSYYDCHKYLINRYISINYQYKFIPTSIGNICMEYLGNPFLFDIGIDIMHNNLNTAILIFEAYLQLNSIKNINIKNKLIISNAWKYLGQILTENENEKNGIIACLNSLKLNPNDLQSLMQMGISYINEQKHKKAFYCLELWLQKHPIYHNIFYDQIINEYNGFNRLSLLFNQALKMNTKDIDLRVILGILYNLQSDFVKSSHEIYKCIELKPNDATLWNKYGATKANNGNYDEAIAAYKKALELKPNYVRVYANLAIAYSNCDKFVQAITCDLMSLSINPKADSDIWDHLESCLICHGALDLVQFCVNRNVDALKNHFDVCEKMT
eukprot:375630_1